MFDEPSSYLDVKQRLKAAQLIRTLIRQDRFIIVVEHDLSVLDYLSDFVCCLYGSPGHYGVVTMPFSVREGKQSTKENIYYLFLFQLKHTHIFFKGINIFLDGFVPTENLRFRESVLSFKVVEKTDDEEIKRLHNYNYPNMSKNLGDFSLEVKGGSFTDSEIIVLLGENGTGKTTLIRMLAGNLEPDEGGKYILILFNTICRKKIFSIKILFFLFQIKKNKTIHPKLIKNFNILLRAQLGKLKFSN